MAPPADIQINLPMLVCEGCDTVPHLCLCSRSSTKMYKCGRVSRVVISARHSSEQVGTLFRAVRMLHQTAVLCILFSRSLYVHLTVRDMWFSKAIRV